MLHFDGHVEYFYHICFERVPKSYLIEYMKFDRYQVTPSSLDEGIEYSGNLNEQIHYAPQESERREVALNAMSMYF